MPETAEIYGRHAFPIAVASKGGVAPPGYIEPTMFYVWVFCHKAEDYVPRGVFNSQYDAGLALAAIEDAYKEKGWPFSGAVLEQSWREFLDQACTQRLGELAEPLRRLRECALKAGYTMAMVLEGPA